MNARQMLFAGTGGASRVEIERADAVPAIPPTVAPRTSATISQTRRVRPRTLPPTRSPSPNGSRGRDSPPLRTVVSVRASFAGQANGFGEILVGNQFARRAKDNGELNRLGYTEAVGPGNDEAILQWADTSDRLVGAWGQPELCWVRCPYWYLVGTLPGAYWVKSVDPHDGHVAAESQRSWVAWFAR